MPSSYVSNHVHIVFSTKTRLTVIPEDLQPKLWAYMAGIAKKHSMHAALPGTAVPGYRLFRPYGTGSTRLGIVPFYRRLIADRATGGQGAIVACHKKLPCWESY